MRPSRRGGTTWRVLWPVVALVVCGAFLFSPRASGATILVRAGGNLQEALDTARGGDVILLEAGATFVGNFLLPGRADSGPPITIRGASTHARLPGERNRVTPVVADLLPKLRSPNREPALRTAPGTRGWRIVMVEFLATAGGAGEIIRLGDGSAAQSTLATVPSDIVLDRCYIHGEPGAPQKRGVALNSASTTVRNSWIAEIKVAGQDSQAIAGWNGPGPFAIVNNYLEAAGQGFMLGGADPAIPGLVPANVMFTGNHVTRPVAWRQASWQVKNLLELKNARDVWIQGNLFEHNWRGGQSGYAILFTPRNQDGGAPWSTVEDVHFRYNVVRRVAAGINILGRDHPNPSGSCRNIQVTNNLLYDVDGGAWGGNGDFLLIGDGPVGVSVEQNTVLQSGKIVSAYGGTRSAPVPSTGFVFRLNLVRHNTYGVHGNDRAVGNDTLAAYFPSAVFTRNVIGGGSASLYPGDNNFPSPSTFDQLFVDVRGGDFRLVAASPAGGGGRAAGADMDVVNSAWRAAQAGERFDSPRFDRDRDDGRRRPPRGREREE